MSAWQIIVVIAAIVSAWGWGAITGYGTGRDAARRADDKRLDMDGLPALPVNTDVSTPAKADDCEDPPIPVKPLHFCTVGDLLDYVEKHEIPHDAPIYYQRIEDKYFENHSWSTVPYVFEQMRKNEPHISQAIEAFQPNWTLTKEGKPIFVIEAHY